MGKKELGSIIDKAISSYHLGQYTPLKNKRLSAIYNAYIADNKNDNVIKVQVDCSCSINGRYYVGRLDQIRELPSGLAVFEIKYSDFEPYECVYRALPQLVFYAYCLDIRIGGVVNVKRYGKGITHYIIDQPAPSKEIMQDIDFYLWSKG